MNINRHDRLLLDLLRDDTDGSRFGADPEDWEHICRRAARFSITPYLYWRLKNKTPGLDVPPKIMAGLRHTYLRSVEKHVRMYHNLAIILGALEKEGIPAILLKGGYLGEIVYEEPGLRVMGDFDILFQPEHTTKAQLALQKAGFLSEKAPVCLDIHQQFDREIKIDMRRIWDRATPVRLSGKDILALSPEDLLLHVCVHMSSHHLFRVTGLRGVCDIREIVRHYGGKLDWNTVFERAREWEVENAVYLGFLVVSELLGEGIIPKSVLENAKPADFDPMMTTWAANRIFRERVDKLILSPYYWRIWEQGTFRQKLLSIRKLLLPKPKHISQDYSVSYGTLTNYAYYAVRFFKFLPIYIRTTWKLLSRDTKLLALLEQERQNVAFRKWMGTDVKTRHP